jgi:hypothetical protein
MFQQGKWLDSGEGHFIQNSVLQHQNTRWFLRKRGGGCDTNSCTNGKCMKPSTNDMRCNTNAACK